MIISKPQTGTIVSFVIFLILTLAVLYMNALVVVNDPGPAWYTYVIIAALTPIALFVLYKIFIRYKVIRLGNNQVELTFPVLRSTKKYPLDQIEYWIERQVKTGKNSLFKELEIRFKDGIKLAIGHKEYSEYQNIVQYLAQKVPKKKRLEA
ncbi:MAG: hypothetical protein AABY93_13340 [Bacteroidota bacterium]